MKLLTILTAALLAATPAKAQWQGNSAQAAADAYCASRAAGNDDRRATRDANTVLSTMVGNGNIPNMFATMLGSGRQQMQTVKYLVGKTCPEYFYTGSATSTTTPTASPETQQKNAEQWERGTGKPYFWKW